MEEKLKYYDSPHSFCNNSKTTQVIENFEETKSVRRKNINVFHFTLFSMSRTVFELQQKRRYKKS